MKNLVKIALTTALFALAGCSGDGNVSAASNNFQETIPSTPDVETPDVGGSNGSDGTGIYNCAAQGEDFALCIEANAATFNQYGSFCTMAGGTKKSGKCASQGEKTCTINGAKVYLSGEAAEESCSEIQSMVDSALSGDMDY